MNGSGSIKILATTAGLPLAEKICTLLSINLCQARVSRFNDGEVDVQIMENVRGHDVYIIAPTHAPAETFMEALHLAEAARLSSAGQVTYVIPYLGYGRSDRKDRPRKPVGAALALRMLEIAQPQRFILLDVHAEQSLSCIRSAVSDHLYGSAIAKEELRKITEGKSFVVASPDKGGVPRAEKFASLLGQDDVVIFSKKRERPGVVQDGSIKIIGDVEGKCVIFVDDIIDTAGTMIADAEATILANAAKNAMDAGAIEIYVFATHGIFSKNAFKRLQESPITTVYVTDSIYHDPEKLAKDCPKVTVLSVAPLLAKAIRRTHQGESLSELIP